MKPTFISLLSIAVFLIGCKDQDPVFCTKNIDLGEFTAQVDMPYDTFQNVQIVSENGSNASISINHPVMLNGPEMFYHKRTVNTYSSDCEAMKTVEKYNWAVKEKRAVLLTTLTSINPPVFLLKTIPIIDDAKPTAGPVGYYHELYERDYFSGTIKQTEFLRILVKELISGEGKKWEKGYEKLDHFTIAGQTFPQVFTNTQPLENGIKQVYFTLDQGIIGFKDTQNILWSVNE